MGQSELSLGHVALLQLLQEAWAVQAKASHHLPNQGVAHAGVAQLLVDEGPQFGLSHPNVHLGLLLAVLLHLRRHHACGVCQALGMAPTANGTNSYWCASCVLVCRPSESAQSACT